MSPQVTNAANESKPVHMGSDIEQSGSQLFEMNARVFSKILFVLFVFLLISFFQIFLASLK